MQAEKVYGVIVKTDGSASLLHSEDLLAAMGCLVEYVPQGPRCRFAALCDEEGAFKDGPGCGLNDLAAYMLSALDFEIRCFPTGVRGNIVIAPLKDGASLCQRDATRIMSLAESIRLDGYEGSSGFEDLLAP
jgi:hypothetical protein